MHDSRGKNIGDGFRVSEAVNGEIRISSGFRVMFIPKRIMRRIIPHLYEMDRSLFVGLPADINAEFDPRDRESMGDDQC